jgi:hypothetical protein
VKNKTKRRVPVVVERLIRDAVESARKGPSSFNDESEAFAPPGWNERVTETVGGKRYAGDGERTNQLYARNQYRVFTDSWVLSNLDAVLRWIDGETETDTLSREWRL